MFLESSRLNILTRVTLDFTIFTELKNCNMGSVNFDWEIFQAIFTRVFSLTFYVLVSSKLEAFLRDFVSCPLLMTCKPATFADT